MLISGVTILLFFIIHLRYFWYTFQITEGSYFNIVLQNKFGFLGHTPTAIFYIISIILISFHLRHGILSSFTAPLDIMSSLLTIVFLCSGIINIYIFKFEISLYISYN